MNEVKKLLPMGTGPKTQSNLMMVSVIMYNKDKNRVRSIKFIPLEVPKVMINELPNGKFKWKKETKDQVHDREYKAIRFELSLKKPGVEHPVTKAR